jgi:hypothetical protein
MQTMILSENAVAVLRFEIKRYHSRASKRTLPAYRELAAAGIMEPVPGSGTDFRFTKDGRARREEILREEENRIERERFEPRDASHLSETARGLLGRRLAGDDRVTLENLDLYRELATARIMYPVSTWASGPESVFRFTFAGWERREEWINERAGARHP